MTSTIYEVKDGAVVALHGEYYTSELAAYKALVLSLELAAPKKENRPEQLEMELPMPDKAKRTHNCRLARRLRVRDEDGNWSEFRSFLNACSHFADGRGDWKDLAKMYWDGCGCEPGTAAERRCETLCRIQGMSGFGSRIAQVQFFGRDGEEYTAEATE